MPYPAVVDEVDRSYLKLMKLRSVIVVTIKIPCYCRYDKNTMFPQVKARDDEEKKIDKQTSWKYDLISEVLLD